MEHSIVQVGRVRCPGARRVFVGLPARLCEHLPRQLPPSHARRLGLGFGIRPAHCKNILDIQLHITSILSLLFISKEKCSIFLNGINRLSSDHDC